MTHQDTIKMLEQEWRDRLEAAVKQEREACAKICSDMHTEGDDNTGFAADTIRARGQQ